MHCIRLIINNGIILFWLGVFNLNIVLFTGRNEGCGQGYVFTRVCDSVHRGRDLPRCMLGYHHTPLGRRHPPGRKHPPKEAPPGIRSMSGSYASYWNAFLFSFSFHVTFQCFTCMTLSTLVPCPAIHVYFQVWDISVSYDMATLRNIKDQRLLYVVTWPLSKGMFGSGPNRSKSQNIKRKSQSN